MGLARVSLRLKNADNAYCVLSWHKDMNHVDASGEERLTVSFHDIDSESGFDAQIAVDANGSLESAGRRVALFNRLLDEHPGSGLPDRQIGILSPPIIEAEVESDLCD